MQIQRLSLIHIFYNGRANHTHGSNAYNVIGRMDYWSGVYHGTGRTLVRFPGLISNFAYQCLDPDDITAVRYVMRENSGKSGTSQIDAYFFKEYWSEGAASYCNVNWNNYDSLLCTCLLYTSQRGGGHPAVLPGNLPDLRFDAGICV